jgi:hypothetical protein
MIKAVKLMGTSGVMTKKVGPLLAVLVTGATVALVPGTASAACDPNGPRGAFVYGIPADDNPAWCETSRPAAAYAYEPAPQHRSSKRHHSRVHESD